MKENACYYLMFKIVTVLREALFLSYNVLLLLFMGWAYVTLSIHFFLKVYFIFMCTCEYLCVRMYKQSQVPAKSWRGYTISQSQSCRQLWDTQQKYVLEIEDRFYRRSVGAFNCLATFPTLINIVFIFYDIILLWCPLEYQNCLLSFIIS